MAPKQIFIAVIGTGGVGKAFLSQLSTLTTNYPQISLVLLSRSSKTLIAPSFTQPLSLTSWSSDLDASSTAAYTPTQIIKYLIRAPGASIVVDNTSSPTIASAYPSFLAAGISVITPNKKAFSSNFNLWAQIQDAAFPANPCGGLIYHESSVGAGLPVLSSLKDLIDTGDEVTRIEGVFSGTLSFLFNSFAPADGRGGGKWSAEVAKAKELGYTEPDPRDDLNGLDVARKLVILARIAGVKVQDTSAFPVESLIPKALEGVGSAEEFMQRLPEFDGEMEGVKSRAEEQGKVVRFLGSVDVKKGEVKVGLEMVEKGSAIAGLKGSDNIISFYTRRYGERPLIVQGAGAGGDVTAMGVTADLIKVLQRLS